MFGTPQTHEGRLSGRMVMKAMIGDGDDFQSRAKSSQRLQVRYLGAIEPCVGTFVSL